MTGLSAAQSYSVKTGDPTPQSFTDSDWHQHRIYTHICTHFSKHCLHIYIYECIMWNILLFGILVWKYAVCKPGNDTTPPPHINSAHFFFLMHLLHLMAHQQLLFKAWELLLSFSISLSLTDSAPPWLLIHPVQRGIYHTMCDFPFSSLKSDPSTSHCYDRN